VTEATFANPEQYVDPELKFDRFDYEGEPLTDEDMKG